MRQCPSGPGFTEADECVLRGNRSLLGCTTSNCVLGLIEGQLGVPVLEMNAKSLHIGDGQLADVASVRAFAIKTGSLATGTATLVLLGIQLHLELCKAEYDAMSASNEESVAGIWGCASVSARSQASGSVG